MANVSKVQGGFNGSVYTCVNCKRRTRETGDGESDLQLCKQCYLEAGYENEHLDNGCHDYEGHIGSAEHAKAHCPICNGREWWQPEPIKEGE